MAKGGGSRRNTSGQFVNEMVWLGIYDDKPLIEGLQRSQATIEQLGRRIDQSLTLRLEHVKARMKELEREWSSSWSKISASTNTATGQINTSSKAASSALRDFSVTAGGTVAGINASKMLSNTGKMSKALTGLRQVSAVAGFELGIMSTIIGRIAQNLLFASAPVALVGAGIAALGAIAYGVFSEIKSQAISKWFFSIGSGKSEAARATAHLNERLKESILVAAKARAENLKTIKQRQDAAYDVVHANDPESSKLDRQAVMVKRQLTEDTTGKNITDKEIAALTETANRQLRFLSERKRALRMADAGALEDIPDPAQAMRDEEDRKLAIATRRSEIGGSDRHAAYMKSMEAAEARDQAIEARRQQIADIRRLPSAYEIKAGGLDTIEGQLKAQRERMFQTANLSAMSNQTGIPQSALSQMLGLSGPGTSGGIGVSKGQLAAIGKAGGIGGAVEPKIERYFKSLPEIEKTLKIIQNQKVSGLKP